MASRSSPRHPSLVRLLEAAEEHEVVGPAALAAALNESDQVITNWGKRGVSRAGAMKAQDKFGCSVLWILEGKLPKVIGAAAQGPLIVREAAGSPYGEPALGPELQELISEWKDIPPWKRGALLERIREVAMQSRDEKAYYMADGGGQKKTVATAELKRQPLTSRTATVVRYGDGNPRQLPLVTASNPFDPDTAPANELAWYKHIKAAPKAAGGR